jgi:tetratricopeptide (TPR) repeat protein
MDNLASHPSRTFAPLAIAVYLLISPFASAAPQSAAKDKPSPPMSAQEWREDLQFLAAQMRLKHKSLFHTMTEAEFTREVAKLDSDIPNLNDDQIYVRLLQLTTLIQDGHSGFDTRPIPSPDLKDHIPVRFVRYPDGIYVRAAAPEYADSVGGKMLKVGRADWQEAIRAVDSMQSHDPGNNGEQLAWSASTLLNCPRLLYGLGLSESRDAAQFLIEKNGHPRAFTMKASVPVGEWYLNSLPSGWVDARLASAPVPLSRQHENKHYWFDYLPEHHAVYFQFNLVINDEGETLAAFAPRLAAALEQPGVERLVIDLRNNTGGDNTLLRPLLVALYRSKVNRRGGIYAITGPTTFSAAQNFVNRLGNYAEVIYLGEPTAENVNFYGDAASITLPHSHLQMGVSHLWWQDEDPRDQRTATFPEIALETTFTNYVAGEDPVLQYALTAPPPQSIEEVLTASLSKGIDGLMAAYKAYLNDPTHKFQSDPERQLNALGYKLLSARRIADAISIFEVNARTHPDSWNAYDSLGEAYANALDKEHALKAYRRSLELNPENAGAKQMIERIENAK